MVRLRVKISAKNIYVYERVVTGPDVLTVFLVMTYKDQHSFTHIMMKNCLFPPFNMSICVASMLTSITKNTNLIGRLFLCYCITMSQVDLTFILKMWTSHHSHPLTS